MRVNWGTVAAWAGVIAMVLMFAMDKFNGSAEATEIRINKLETKCEVIQSTLEVELRNISMRLAQIERKIR